LPLIVALILAVLAVASASVINGAVALSIALPEDAALAQIDATAATGATEVVDPTAARASRVRAMSRTQYVDGILGRNLFDSTAIGKAGVDGGEEFTDLNFKLIATIVAEPTTFSSALIAENGRESSALGYGIGDKLMDAEVVAIEQKRVTIRRADGQIQYLGIEEGAEERAPERAATSEEPAEGGEEGITQISETHYAVDRSVVD
jgi:hypothetical protein